MVQGKVSMVMTCYNKFEYISHMFDSILAQEWNNIEVILVNDGSTDGTREIIAEYMPKFVARGYEVIIIDQENSGVCTAAKAGLENVSGDYVCCLDADDELMPDYCTILAGALEKDCTLDYVAGSYINVCNSGEEQLISFNISKYWRGEQLIRFCLLNASLCVPWAYMIRAAYFKQCRIVENYIIKTRGSHEPGFIIPLHAYCGNFKYLKDAHVYKYYFERETGHSAMTDVPKIFSHWAEYVRLGNLAVANLPGTIASKTFRDRCIKYLVLFEKWVVFNRLQLFSSFDCYQNSARQDYIKTLKNSGFLPSVIFENINADDNSEIVRLHFSLLRRVICVGAKGKVAKKLIPQIKQYICVPDEYWDESAKSGDITEDGTPIYPPQYNDLNHYDVLLILPTNKDVVTSILAKISFVDNVLFSDTIQKTIEPLKVIGFRRKLI